MRETLTSCERPGHGASFCRRARRSRPGWLASAALVAIAGPVAAQVTIVTTDDPAFVNDQIGTLLNGTSSVNGKPHFPVSGDPAQNFGPGEAPDLSAAAAVLGDWLDPVSPDFSAPGWSQISSPTINWAVNTEIALAYAFEVQAITGLVAEVGVDNGVYVWLNGEFIGGRMRPGFAVPGEHTFDLGDLPAGSHHVQFILEDHGTTNGFDLKLVADAFVTTEGDYNGNGQVEQGDLDLVLQNWGDATPPVPDGWINDLPDGAIEQAELDRVLQNWGSTQAPALAPASLPEPAGAAVLGLVGLSAARRR